MRHVIVAVNFGSN